MEDRTIEDMEPELKETRPAAGGDSDSDAFVLPAPPTSSTTSQGRQSSQQKPRPANISISTSIANSSSSLNTATPLSSAGPGSSTSKPTNNNARIFIGNLPPTLSEFTLLKLFQPFGKIKALEYLFHKSGPLQGLPKGYAFVEYENPESAVHAIAGMHGKKIGSKSNSSKDSRDNNNNNKPRTLVVSFSVDPSYLTDNNTKPGESPIIATPKSTSAPTSARTPYSSSAPYGPRSLLRKDSLSRDKHTKGEKDSSSREGSPMATVNSIKTSAKLGSASTDAKIEALERRLKMLEEG